MHNQICNERTKAVEHAFRLACVVQEAGGHPKSELAGRVWVDYCIGAGTMEKPIGDARMVGLECGFSLAQAIHEAGGRVGTNILDMTLREFMGEVAAQNHIRFVYDKPPEKK